MDVTQAIITRLSQHISGDADLQALMPSDFGGPWMKVPADTTMPFLVHRLDTIDGLDRATRPANYTIEVWDYGTSMGDKVWPIRERLMALLDNVRLTVPNQGTLRLWHASDAQLPNEDTNVMTLALTFQARYGRSGEVRNMLLQTQKGTP